MAPLDALIEKVLDREGGITDVGDGKGVTRFGQTPDWLARFHLPVPTDRASAAANYAAWLDAIGFAPLVAPGDSLADILLDVAVMSGEGRAVMLLQAALGVAADGALGPRTLAALASVDRRQAARNVVAANMEFQGRIITDDPAAHARYAAGWATRLADHVRRLS